MYLITTTNDFDRQFRRLDSSVQIMVKKWIAKHLVDCEDPRTFGKALSANLKGYWRYRIGDYRLLVEIKDHELIIVAVAIDHRSQVYKKLAHGIEIEERSKDEWEHER